MVLDGVAAASLLLVVLVVWAAGNSRRSQPYVRDERGKSDDSFMKKVVKVSLLVMIIAGGMVWLIDRAEDNPAPGNGSNTDSPQHHKGKNGNDR